MSSIQERAKIELDRINFGDGDTQAMLSILRIFFGTWDSGGAVSVAIPVLTRLLEGKPLAPLTGEDAEWYDAMGDGKSLQNVRMTTVFKDMPAGRCYDIEDPERRTITFPYSGYIPVSGLIELGVDCGEATGDATVRVIGERLWDGQLRIDSIEEVTRDTLTTALLKRGKAWMERELVDEISLDDAPAPYRGIPIDGPFETSDESDPRHPIHRQNRFRKELEGLINSCCMENGSDTPDFMLAAFLADILLSFDSLMQTRDKWYGGSHRHLKGQLEAEGAHTAAANAEIERLNRLLDGKTQST